MLIAILIALALLFLGGDNGLLIVEKIQDRVPYVITEKEEAKAILEHADSMNSIARDARKELAKDLKAWSKADKNHSVGRGALKLVIDKSADKRQQARKAFLDELFEMKSKMTKEQWEIVFKE